MRLGQEQQLQKQIQGQAQISSKCTAGLKVGFLLHFSHLVQYSRQQVRYNVLITNHYHTARSSCPAIQIRRLGSPFNIMHSTIACSLLMCTFQQVNYLVCTHNMRKNFNHHQSHVLSGCFLPLNAIFQYFLVCLSSALPHRCLMQAFISLRRDVHFMPIRTLFSAYQSHFSPSFTVAVLL